MDKVLVDVYNRTTAQQRRKSSHFWQHGWTLFYYMKKTDRERQIPFDYLSMQKKQTKNPNKPRVKENRGVVAKEEGGRDEMRLELSQRTNSPVIK